MRFATVTNSGPQTPETVAATHSLIWVLGGRFLYGDYLPLSTPAAQLRMLTATLRPPGFAVTRSITALSEAVAPDENDGAAPLALRRSAAPASTRETLP